MAHLGEQAVLFQSTRPRGRTRLGGIIGAGVEITGVSIHASSREDATWQIILFLRSVCFNPRVLAGGRDKNFSSKFLKLLFQSTRPRGRTRLDFTGATIQNSGFNPRVLAGGRDVMTGVDSQEKVFQSTRPRGRTRPSGLFFIMSSKMFQSTRPRGRTRHARTHLAHSLSVSIHASSREDATESL